VAVRGFEDHEKTVRELGQTPEPSESGKGGDGVPARFRVLLLLLWGEKNPSKYTEKLPKKKKGSCCFPYKRFLGNQHKWVP